MKMHILGEQPVMLELMSLSRVMGLGAVCHDLSAVNLSLHRQPYGKVCTSISVLRKRRKCGIGLSGGDRAESP